MLRRDRTSNLPAKGDAMMDATGPVCPIPVCRYPSIVMAHGGGGRLMRDLIEQVFVAAFRSDDDAPLHDAATVSAPSGRLAFTTDSFVVRPLFFPGSDIGALAVFGTVNDLAMGGAQPLCISASYILEEGLPIQTLQRVAGSMRAAADRAGVRIVTGDTKVVEKGRCDGMYITTAGIGIHAHDVEIGPSSVHDGDAVIVSGDLGRHGIAVMAVREGFQFDVEIESDCAPLWEPVRALLDAGIAVHCLRDLTRGGLASALVEIAESARVAVFLDEDCIPVAEPVRSACELLGYDPLHVANEGRFVAFVAPSDADRAVTILRSQPVSAGAVRIGTARCSEAGSVMLATVGGQRPVDMLSGEQLPRIC
jgi:hydrogenase expression/formation protein HypE